MRWLTAVKVSIILVVVVCVAYIAFVAVGMTRLVVDCSPGLGEIARLTSLDFPASAKLVDSNYAGFQDRELFAVVRMSRGEAHRLLDSARGRSEVSSDDMLGVSSQAISAHAPKWWQPGPARKFVAVWLDMSRRESHQMPHVGMLIHMEDAREAIIYVRAAT